MPKYSLNEILQLIINIIAEETGVIVTDYANLYNEILNYDYLDTINIFQKINEVLKSSATLAIGKEHEIASAQEFAEIYLAALEIQ